MKLYLREKKARDVEDRYSYDFQQRQELKILEYENAIVFPRRKTPDCGTLFGLGGVAEENGNYIEDSKIEFAINGIYPFNNPVFENKVVVYCGFLKQHWGHFLIDSVPRLWYYLENDNDSIDSYVFIVDENTDFQLKGNFKRFLELFGIMNKIQFINKPTQFKRVIIPQPSYQRYGYYSIKFKDIFDHVCNNVVQTEVWTANKKVFLSRNALNDSCEIGLQILDDFFTDNGYEVIYPEKLELGELLFKLRSAEQIATMDGSIAHNVLFAKDKANILYLDRRVLPNQIQIEINKIRNIEATYIDVSLPIYPTSGSGPNIVFYTEQLRHFASDHKMIGARHNYLTKKYIKWLFDKYISQYNKLYGKSWYMEPWYENEIGLLYEGYKDGEAVFKEQLIGRPHFSFKQHIKNNEYVYGTLLKIRDLFQSK